MVASPAPRSKRPVCSPRRASADRLDVRVDIE